MFGLFSLRKPEVHKHQGTYIEKFSVPPGEFYAAIEREIAALGIPDIAVSRVFYREGGPVSAEREYLRIGRGRLGYIVCAASWGTSFFFSKRFTEKTRNLRVWEVVAMLAFLASAFAAYWQFLGLVWGIIIFVLNVIAAAMLCRNAVAMGWDWLDDLLLRLPVIGTFYENYLRPGAYFKDDTLGLFVNLADSIVDRQIKAFTADSGVTLGEFKDLKPEGKLAAFVRKLVGG
ncbi:MAG: hypothetical protein K1X78_10190 [Verrucomicrobiaceae bacterium]|nr:hypothetical protein [Verrucomicrobiaceae bacterium]